MEINMLKQRVITGIILVIAVTSAILFLPDSLFAILSAVIMLGIGGWEWAKLSGFHDQSRQLLFLVALALFAVGIYISFDSFYLWLSIVSILTWLLILFLLSIYSPQTRFYHHKPWVLRLLALPVLLLAWAALLQLREVSETLVIYLVLLIAVADTSAFFSGKRFGKNKLAPDLSPGKTLEGMLGALVGSIIWALLGALYFKLSPGDWVYFILLSMVAVLLSIAGDLFESLLKRQAGEKDSGKILPGHGGVLDRIDSILAAAPFFTLGIVWGNVVLHGGQL
jgi:phosphatidate cytidylyltransferase